MRSYFLTVAIWAVCSRTMSTKLQYLLLGFGSVKVVNMLVVVNCFSQKWQGLKVARFETGLIIFQDKMLFNLEIVSQEHQPSQS